MFRSKKSKPDLVNETSEITRHSSGGRLAAIISAIALVFSGISLYETVLKQPQLNILVPSTLHYARDIENNMEIVAVPITIANNGARDGAVVEVLLSVTNLNSNKTKEFTSTYFADAYYFVGSDNYNIATKKFERKVRPKVPFAPLSVAGRSAYTGTVLFYTTGEEFPKLVDNKGQYRISLKLVTPGGKGRFSGNTGRTISFVTEMDYFNEGELLRGSTHRMTRKVP